MNETNVYTIESRGNVFYVLRDGVPRENNKGYVRTYASRNSARKAVSRLRRGVTS